MENCRTTKDIIREFCEKNLAPHTDWTGTRVETQYECDSVETFVDRLWEWIKDNHYKA